MCGTWRTSGTGRAYIYYRCPHDPANPRHAAAHPDHGPVSLREDAIMAAIGRSSTSTSSATTAPPCSPPAPRHTPSTPRPAPGTHAHLRAELARIDTAEHALITELEQPADPADPAAQAYRARIRARFADLYAERTRTEAQLADLQAAAPRRTTTPPCSTCCPTAAALFTDAPDRIKEALLAAFDIQALYRHDQDQVTIWATLTDAPPHHRRPARRPPHRQRHRHPGPDPGHVFPFSTRPYDRGNDPRSRERALAGRSQAREAVSSRSAGCGCGASSGRPSTGMDRVIRRPRGLAGAAEAWVLGAGLAGAA